MYTVEREFDNRITFLNQEQTAFVPRSQAGHFDYKEARMLARQWRPTDSAAYSISETVDIHPLEWLIALASFVQYAKSKYVMEYQRASPHQRLEEWKHTNTSGQTLWRIMVDTKDNTLYWRGNGEAVERILPKVSAVSSR